MVGFYATECTGKVLVWQFYKQYTTPMPRNSGTVGDRSVSSLLSKFDAVSHHLPVGVPVAHCVVTRVLLVLLVHLEADPFNTTLLHFVLVTAILAGGQRGWLTLLVHQRLSTVPLELCGFSD